MIASFVLDEPRVDGNVVRFSWSVEPPTVLLRESAIELTFPPETDLARVPRGLLWTAMLAVLHPIWILLRPLRVRFPITLEAEEAARWQRLMRAGIETLEGIRETAFVEPCVFFAFDGPALPSPEPAPERGATASAFSGGKDSLLQACLLREIGCDPLLVTVTSELPPLRDHLTVRRAELLRDVPLALGLAAAEVRTEARALWDNGFAGRLGYGIAVSELTDTHLYFAALLIAGAAAGATHLFLASEADVQTMDERDGALVQSPHFMYTVATQAALAAIVAPYGITVSSLTAPIFNAQVQRLLWTRYPQAAAFQYSCWRVTGDGQACSGCSQCLRIALGILAAGHDPRRAGLDTDAVMAVAAAWEPKWIASDGPQPVGARARADLSAQLIETVRSIDLALAARLLGPAAFDAFLRLHRRLAAEPSKPTGMRPSFAGFLDPLVREPAMQVYTAAFPPPWSDDDATAYERSRALADALATGGRG